MHEDLVYIPPYYVPRKHRLCSQRPLPRAAILQNQLCFTATDDQWSDGWRERTGFPFSNYKERWNNLRMISRSTRLHPGDPQNRSPTFKSFGKNPSDKADVPDRKARKFSQCGHDEDSCTCPASLCNLPALISTTYSYSCSCE